MRTLTSLSFALLSLFLLAACAGVNTFDRHLKSFVGHPVNDMAIVYGPHDGEYTDISGATVYVWQDAKTESLFGKRVTGGAGYHIGAPTSHGDAFVWSGIEHHSCVIRASTTDGIVRKVTFEGDPGGCETIHGYRKDKLGHDFSD